jgi:thymidylate synthase
MTTHTTETPNPEEEQFINVIKTILHTKRIRPSRTEVGTKSIFGVNLSFNLTHTFPLLTTRRLCLRIIFEELMWFLRGETDVAKLKEKKVFVWNDNTTREFLDKRGLTHYKVGDIGPSYSFQFRHSGAVYRGCEEKYDGEGVDQLSQLIETIRTNPFSRRLIIELWNPVDTDKMALPPCMHGYQFYVGSDDQGQPSTLSCKVTQRSSDIALAGGWNIASASLFLTLVAYVCDLVPHTLIWSVGDCHLYTNQLDTVQEQIQRQPRPFPRLSIRDGAPKDITKIEFKDIMLEGYNPYKRITFAMNA